MFNAKFDTRKIVQCQPIFPGGRPWLGTGLLRVIVSQAVDL